MCHRSAKSDNCPVARMLPGPACRAASWPNLNEEVSRVPVFSLSKSLTCCSLSSDGCLTGDKLHAMAVDSARRPPPPPPPVANGQRPDQTDWDRQLSAGALLPSVVCSVGKTSLLTKAVRNASDSLANWKSEDSLFRRANSVTTVRGRLSASEADLTRLHRSLSRQRLSLDLLSPIAPNVKCPTQPAVSHAADEPGPAIGQPPDKGAEEEDTVPLDRAFAALAVEDRTVPDPSSVPKRRDGENHHRERNRQTRAASMVVPAITPRLPLMGLLPKSVGKPVEKCDFVKPKDKALKLRCSKKHVKAKEVKPHFWISTVDRCPSRCDVCGKAGGDFYQCNDCAGAVHQACKASADKQSCPAKAKPPSKHSSLVFPTRPLSIVSRFSLRSETGGSDLVAARNSFLPVDGLQLLPDGVPVYSAPDVEWSRAGLWDEDCDAETWSTGRGKELRSELSSRDVKRQDIIHELYVTEKHHCTTLVILKHTYFDGLLELEILSEEELNAIMPNLDLMLKMHLAFLQSMKRCIDRSVVVNDVHEVFLELFTGEPSLKMQTVYTYFCAQKESSVDEYRKLYQTNANFQYFVESLNRSSCFKSRSLPDCLLLVTQRLSKYHSFVENLRKNTTDPSAKEGMVKAELAVKKLIAEVDAGIGLMQLQQLRQKLYSQMDSKDSGTLFLGKPFTAEDLKSPCRELLYAGDVRWQTARRKPIDVSMLLFSDVIVFLQRIGHGQYTFCTQDNKEAVISLQKLIVREKAGRMGSQGLYLISTAPRHAEMYEIVFHTKKNLAAWTERIQRAVEQCPPAAVLDDSDRHSLESDESHEQLKMLLDKASENGAHLKDCLEEQLGNYASILEVIGEMTFRSEEEKSKLLGLIDGCLPSRMGEWGVARFVDLTSRMIREQCKQHLVGLTGCSMDPVAEPETCISRSQTFHGLRSGRRNSKLYRKHVTVSGIPNALDKCRSSDIFEHNYPECRASSKGHLFSLLAGLKDAEFEIERLKREKAALLLEHEREKSARSVTGQAAYNTGLEELRRLHAELDRRRADFQQTVDEKTAELDAREKALQETAAKMDLDNAALQNKLERFKEAWEKLQLSAVSGRPAEQSTNAVDRLVYGSSSLSVDWSLSENQQTTGSRRPEVPPYLLGSFVHGGLVPEGLVRQQLPSKLVKDDFATSLSSKIQCSMRDRKKASSKAKDQAAGLSRKK